jgi:hypothetical protein
MISRFSIVVNPAVTTLPRQGEMRRFRLRDDPGMKALRVRLGLACAPTRESVFSCNEGRTGTDAGAPQVVKRGTHMTPKDVSTCKIGCQGLTCQFYGRAPRRGGGFAPSAYALQLCLPGTRSSQSGPAGPEAEIYAAGVC